MKYRVHQYVTVRVPVDIEANSIKEAVKKADRQFDPRDVISGEYAEEGLGYQVDPILDDGEIDYDKGVSCEWNGEELVDFDGEPVNDVQDNPEV